MPLDQLFRIASTVVLVGWLALALAPLKRPAMVTTARLVAALLCGGYVAIVGHALATGPAPSGASFMTLDGIASLFSSRTALLGGWVHYLAFDLWVGSWEVEDAPRARVPHWLLLICLVLTFLAGPAGLLLYLLVKAARRR
ncbi:ABA4-like family protein [Glacieibacterium frigidum]|uniref:DUF4281 domain-containing protein n=1 Tax=Glacieibacterium frigidum TaxID=2593303 RepID=A0A552UFI1_9SPHN|nr:ABA4-like family protein [Glacieibacterium frigidum]TRW16987.1 DUF4281 domain-containing protein [Glacieibacterium frigidum]